MLEWLGVKHGVQQMTTDAQAIRTAIDSLVASRSTVTPDLGGTARTNEIGHAVLNEIAANT